MQSNFDKPINNLETNGKIVLHNFRMMITDMKELSNTESMGGNAGTRIIGGINYSCIALNGYADQETGKIMAFGNIQDISPDVLAKGIPFTFIQAINVERKITKIVDFLNSDQFSKRAIDNINNAVIEYNEIYNPSDKNDLF